METTDQAVNEAAGHSPSVLSRSSPERTPCAWPSTESWTLSSTSSCTHSWRPYECGRRRGTPGWRHPIQCHQETPTYTA